MTATEIRKRIASIVGRRRSGEITIEFECRMDGRRKDTDLIKVAISPDDRFYKARCRWYAEIYSGKAIKLQEASNDKDN